MCSEEPEIIIEDENEHDIEFDIPATAELTVVIGEDGEPSYVDCQRPDGSMRRLLTKPAGGALKLGMAGDYYYSADVLRCES